MSLLLAGINDGRHVLATIMHLLEQFQELSTTKQQAVHVTLVANDLNVASMARFVVTLVILSKIGRNETTLADMDADAKEWCNVLQYVFLSYAMPPRCLHKLVQVLKEIKELNTKQAFEKHYPWLMSTSDTEWEQVQLVLSYWIHQTKKQSEQATTEEALPYPSTWKDIPSTREALDRHWIKNDDIKAAWETPQTGTAKMIMEERWVDAMYLKESHMERMSDIRNWDSKMKKKYSSMLGPGATKQAIINRYMEHVKQLPAYHFDEEVAKMHDLLRLPGVHLADSFLSATKAILPPNDDNTDPTFKRVYEIAGDYCFDDPQEEVDDVLHAAMKSASLHVRRHWTTNPLMFDPLYNSITFSQHGFDPILGFVENFPVVEHCQEPLPKDGSMTQFSDRTTQFFWNAGHALVMLCETNSALRLEWSAGDIISLCQSFSFAAEGVSQRRFHKIQASNIPDYTGMLSFFTEVLPLLHDTTPDVTPRMHVNLLLNNPIWKDYAHFIHSSTGIQGLKDVERILGMKHLGDPNISCWAEYTWSRTTAMVSKTKKQEVIQWLHRLFLICIIPPERNAHDSHQERCVNTIAMFVRVCVFCIDQIGYPVHWITCLLDELLSLEDTPKMWKTEATVPTMSPSAYDQEAVAHNVNISPFLLELRTQVALALQKRQSHCQSMLQLIEMAKIPDGPVQQYEMSLPLNLLRDLKGRPPSFGNPFNQVLALALEPSKPPLFGEEDEETSNPFFQMMMKGMRRPEPIRDDILSKGSNRFVVISCLECEAVDMGVSIRIRFNMHDTDFQRYGDYYVSVLRTDGWSRLGPSIKLHEAKASV